jgi:hypothetical protein
VWVNFVTHDFLPLRELCRYEEAREEEKMRSQREDFSDMVAEVC